MNRSTINPKISVIVPVYNVGEYLRECLDSLVNQSLEDIEVIMINDGSTDQSPEIIDEYASKYDHFYAYHREHTGVSNARNYGIQFARGQYLAFCDADDIVSRDAYKKLYDMAQETGSEIVIGNTMRFNSKKKYESGLHKKVFRETTKNTHITKMPQLIYNTTCWNGIFLHDFWKKHNLRFPDMVYEDIPVMTAAFFYSTSTSLIEDVVYYWRERDGSGNLSLTQQRHKLSNFLDRMKSIQMVNNFYKNHNIVDEVLVIEKDYKFLSLDIMLFFKQLSNVDDEYIKNFVKAVNSLLTQVNPKAFDRLNAIDKLKYRLLQEEKIDELLNVLDFEKNKIKYAKPKKKNNRYYADYPYRSELPKELFDVTDELKPVCRIEEMNWEGNTLKIKGHTYISKVDSKFASQVNLKATIKRADSSQEIELPVKLTKRKDVTQKYGVKPPNAKILFFRRLYSYDWSGFEVDINFDQEDLFQLVGTGKLEVWFTLRVGSLERRFRVNGPVKGDKPRTHAKVIKGKLIEPRYNAAWELTLETIDGPPTLNEPFIQDDKLVFNGQGSLSESDSSLVLIGNKNSITIPITTTGSTTFTAHLPLNETDLQGDRYQVYLSTKSHNKQKLFVYTDRLTKKYEYWRGREIHYDLTNNSTLIIWAQMSAPYIINAYWADNQLNVTVFVSDFYQHEFDQIYGESIIVQSLETGKSLKFAARKNEDILKAVIPLRDGEGNLHFLDGKWAFYVDVEGIKDGKPVFWKKRIQQPPQEKVAFLPLIYSKQRFKPYISKDGYFNLSVKLVWSIVDRGPRQQKILQKIIYPLFRLLPMNRKMIVFQSYWGFSYSCNPRAIYEYIYQHEGNKYKYIWVFKNENTPIEGNAVKVRERSWKYYYYMARAKFFVNNVNFPDFYEKRKGAIEIQTLHGTFLKTMGLDVPGEVDTPEKKKKFLRRCGRWDYLISPSRYMTEKARECFLYDREVIEIGFPRNDVLVRTTNINFNESLKNKLNLPLDKKIILYAPTYRVKEKFTLQLDLKRMQEQLSEEYILLLRLHYFVASNLDIDPYRGFAFNVSSYDKVEDLYLISDLLITDYSSVMFDFALLNRPILYYTYDLEYYRDQLRGMYINLEQEAPGPLLRTTEELIEAIRNLDQVVAQYSEKLKAFREKYGQFESGNACKYVLEHVIKAHK